ncbi:hypothetical protein [Streptomyces wuyuanensis]|uniref:Uncharacterized protein n=1 Tax=Streptomyces wuyuanensis TaxID=1196353 RepID=A0A1G9YYV7_9ACTN|nr:hypothetical protein [Streptomyces wuyuanensis]SDN13895.1 hypothetical protein SAMN05444921_12013 [Streptomyces wuyuanensis]
MHSPHRDARPPLPVVRAAVFALVGGVLGLTAHHLAAREPADWAASGPAAAVLFAVGLAQARRPRRLSHAIAVNAAAQAALHEWFMRTGSGTTGPSLHGHPGGTAGAHGPGQEVLLGPSATTVAHALAAVLVAVLLHGADAACWSPPHAMAAVLARVRKPIHAVWSLLSAPPAPVRPRAAPYPPRRTERRAQAGSLLTEVVVRRGPPAGVRTPLPAREPALEPAGPTHHDPETP